MSVAWWQNRLYPTDRSRNPVRQFIDVIEQTVTSKMDVLDLGAGAGELNQYHLKGRVRKMVGVDMDPRVVENPLLDEGVVGDIGKLPFPDNSFDFAFSIYVQEHIADPEAFVAEVHRVLRPGGLFLCLTPNRFHYVPIIASLTPTSFHKWFNSKRGRDAEDTFPTLYRMNRRGALKAQFFNGGFDHAEFRMIEVQPNYLTRWLPAFLVGAAYERLVNSTEWLSFLRVNIIGIFQNGDKPAEQQRLAA